jgi:serine phosphatase RsbU (regulator of sigma subunit)
MQFSIDGFSYQYLWPFSSWLANHAILIFSSLSIYYVLQYAYFMLNKSMTPNLKKLFKAEIYLALLVFVLSFSWGKIYAWTFPLANFLGIVSTLTVFISSVYIYFKNRGVSPLFVSGFGFLTLGALLFIFDNFNIVEDVWFFKHGIKLGSVIEVTFLSVLMAGKYRELQQEKEKAQQAAIERLEKLNEIQSKQKELLEKEVEAKTKEILQQKAILEQKNREVIESINYAKRIQTALIPRIEQYENLKNNMFVLFLPKDIVSGDFYWFHHTTTSHKDRPNEDYMLLAVADCTGHGVPGAMISTIGIKLLYQSVKQPEVNSPAEALDYLSAEVEQTFNRNVKDEFIRDGMDMAMVAINLESRKMMYAGANNPCIIIRKGEIIILKPDKKSIGKCESDAKFTNVKFTLEKGDMIYLFSDGFQDQFGGPKNKKFKSKNFRKLLSTIYHYPVNEQRLILEQTIKDWMGNEYSQIDDITVLGYRVD